MPFLIIFLHMVLAGRESFCVPFIHIYLRHIFSLLFVCLLAPFLPFLLFLDNITYQQQFVQVSVVKMSCTFGQVISPFFSFVKMLWHADLHINHTFCFSFSGLQDHDLCPDKIDYVICTHGHSDHVGNLNLFPSSCLVVSYDICHRDRYTVHDFAQVNDLLVFEIF